MLVPGLIFSSRCSTLIYSGVPKSACTQPSHPPFIERAAPLVVCQRHIKYTVATLIDTHTLSVPSAACWARSLSNLEPKQKLSFIHNSVCEGARELMRQHTIQQLPRARALARCSFY